MLLALVLVGFGGFFFRAWQLYRLLLLGRNEDRTDKPARRLRDEIVIYLGQRKLIKRPYWIRGITHALIFWGFLVITYGSADLLLRGILGWQLPGTTSPAYMWILDIFAVAVLVSVAIAMYRRAFLRPPRMHIVREGYVILAMIAFLMLTLLVFESAAIAGVRDPGHIESAAQPPVASVLAYLIPTAAGPVIFAGTWWAHVLTILAFAVYLPETTPPAHYVESKPEELWACTTCAACVEACPVTIEHIDKIVDMRRHLTLMEGSAPPEAQRAMTNIERAGNPWGEARETRGDWAK